MGIDKKSVFLLTCADSGRKKAFGTGFAVAHRDGQLFILTCAHVVDQLDGRVSVGGKAAEIEALGSADGIDLALLRISCGQSPPLLNRPVLGEPEMKFHICGYGPFAGAKGNYVLRHIEGKLGKSIAFESVRGIGRIDAWDLHVEDDDFSRLQGGYSGSPLCDDEGGLVAVVSHKIGGQGQRGHAVALANLKVLYPDIEQLIPSFADTDNRIRIIRKGPFYRYLPDSPAKRWSFSLIAVALLAGLFISIKYQSAEIGNRGKGNSRRSGHEHLDGKTQRENDTPKQMSSAVPPKQSIEEESEADIPPIRLEVNADGSDEHVTDPVTGIKFVSLPGGCFQMGSPHNKQGRRHNEGPIHEVCLDDFRMGKYEVTQGQWLKIMGSNPSEYQKGDEYPVEKVSWNTIQDFIEKLNEKSGQNYRLPTEAEWEYAARAGTNTARYWGDDISCERAMYGNDKYQEVSCMDYIRSEEALTPYSTAPVGSYPPNQFGLYDMLGNVSEFCSNWLGFYPSAQLHNPQGPAKGDARVFRGGSLGNGDSWIRSAVRYGLPLHERDGGIGFRLVLPLQGSQN